MAMSVGDRKEALGQAYVRAVVAKAGFNIAKSEKDYGLDGTIKDVVNRNGRYHENGIAIEYQLKSSSNVSFEGDYIVYDLESKNYNDLALWEGTSPGILILFVMPSDESDWVTFDEERLEIRHCAWWCSLEGEPPTENAARRRIKISKANVFSPEALEAMMTTVRGGNRL